MFLLECVYALLAEIPSFIDIIVRHALNILGAL